MKKIRILLVDDHALVRLGLMTLLNDQPDMEVAGEASTAAEAVNAAEKLSPDVTLMDIRLPGEGGIEAREILQRLGQLADETGGRIVLPVAGAFSIGQGGDAYFFC